ncbi:uncharacterized protein LOC124922006 isoform X1 [Impatiens glandulifera]|uniref:uncharacterized protein LOC124922006 isoform X1 n=1 Tax=Impatiens glandulifera TaxID=253017 RepID=UPI001FB063DB|nr:uncharacterized protein LOC124922006 isoform X1 [Impatiens glandulifera]
MDLDEWELLPDYTFLEIHDVRGAGAGVSSDPSDDFKADYFSCPSPNSHKQVIHLDPSSSPSYSAKDIVFDQKVEAPKFEVETEHDDDIVSQVSFNKENEFVDMKIDSPKSRSRSPLPQIDLGSFQFEMKNEVVEVTDDDHDHDHDHDKAKDNIWKRSLNGIGAICSFGVAAATFCFIVLGTQQKNKKDIRFQIYADDKRIKQVMTQHAAKMNGAISAMRGVSVPLARAHITVGGYYDGL